MVENYCCFESNLPIAVGEGFRGQRWQALLSLFWAAPLPSRKVQMQPSNTLPPLTITTLVQASIDNPLTKL